MSEKLKKVPKPRKPSRKQAEEAVKTLLLWAGEDTRREGLIDTPKRVVRAYEDWFSGYKDDPIAFLARTFEEVEGYDEMIVLRDIEFESHCEHHMAPIIGHAHVGYLPNNKVVGISKLARVVEAFARRFQVQEKMTAQIANCIQDVLSPKGVGVVIEAAHQCMTTRGVHKTNVTMVTSQMLGSFRKDARTRAEFLRMIPGARLQARGMIRKLGLIVLAFLALSLLYLLAWPVPVEPVAWDAPEDEGLSGAFTPNDILAATRGINLGSNYGPEDIAIAANGTLFAAISNGTVLQVGTDGRRIATFATTGGRPLGLDFGPDGALWVANATHGLQRVTRHGQVADVLNEVNGQPLVYADDVAVAANGKVYLTEASTKFGAAQYEGTLEGSLLDLLEHGAHGMVLEYDPQSDTARVLLDNLNFANGIAVSDDQQFLLVAETGSYRILKHWLTGPRAGDTEVLLDNLPGFPDNINNGLNGRFWIGLAAPRNALLDRLSDKPFLRKVVQRLPNSLRPGPARSSHVIAINGDGDVLMSLQDSAARTPLMTGAVETRDFIYFSTLVGNQLPMISKQDLL